MCTLDAGKEYSQHMSVDTGDIYRKNHHNILLDILFAEDLGSCQYSGRFIFKILSFSTLSVISGEYPPQDFYESYRIIRRSHAFCYHLQGPVLLYRK